MLYPTEEYWQERGIEDENQLFVVLLWHELFDRRTPDTWQVRTTGVIGALREIVRCTDVALNDHKPYLSNLQFVIQELLHSAKMDPVVNKKYPCIQGMFSAKDEVTKQTLPQLRRKANICLHLLSDYRERIFDELTSACAPAEPKHAPVPDAAGPQQSHSGIMSGHGCAGHPMPQMDAQPSFSHQSGESKGRKVRKRELRHLLMCLATELRNSGYSVQYLKDLGRFFTAKEFADGLPSLKERTTGKAHSYSVTIAVKWDAALLDEQVSATHVKFTRDKPTLSDCALDDERDYWRKSPERAVHAIVQTKALDSSAATEKALMELNRFFASVNLYNTDSHYAVSADKAIVRCGDGTVIMERVPGFSLPALNILRNTPRLVGEFLGIMSGLPNKDEDRMSAALQYHRLALASESPASCLVNLWIGLESLISIKHQAKISAVCSSIAPTVALNNIFKILRELSKYIRFFLAKRPFPDLEEVFPNSTNRRIDPGDLLEVLVQPKRDNRYAKLDSFCQSHVLLRNRLGYYREKVFRKPKSVADYIERHQLNVEWQLRRIYRARNEIAHRAEIPPGLIQLVHNLHTYFVTTMYRLVYVLKKTRSELSIAEAFEYNRSILVQYLDFMKSQDGRGATRKLLLDPRKVNLALDGPGLWLEQDQ